MKRLIAALPLLIAGIAHADSTAYEWDGAHSTVGFTVKHMVVSETSGKFKDVSAKVALDDADLTKSQVSIEIKVDSISTDNADRDKHLKSPDFFDVQKFPTLTFNSKKIVKAGKGYKLTGDLKIRSVTKEVTLDAEVSPAVKTPWGKQMRAVTAKGKINRKDFGLTWNKALETGGLVVGEEVTIDVKAEITK